MNNPGQYKWHFILLGTLLLYQVLPMPVIEQYYSNWIYLKIHTGLYWIFRWIPFPGFYLVLVAVLLLLLKWLMILVSQGTIWYKLTRITGNVSKWVVWFFVLWGFNYGRVPLENELGLVVRPLTREDLLSEIDTMAHELITLRRHMEKDTVPVPPTYFQYRSSANDKLIYTLRQWGYEPVRVECHELAEDILLRFDVGGLYLPYTGEANMDAGVHYYSKPFYIMHEMCHANGFTDEAACNFAAYAAASNFNEPGFQYSVQINYFRYLMTDLYNLDSLKALDVKQNLPDLLKFDLELLKRHALQHTYKTSVLGEAVNNRYLKLMGIPEGTLSYNKMVQLVYAWRHPEQNK